MSRRDANTTKVFVGSLPATVTTDDLKRLFEPYGKIVECDIANRCGFLHLEDKDLATKAIEELNNTNFMGGKISVEKGRVKPPRRNREGGRGGRDRGGPYARNDGYGRGPPPRNPPMGGGYGRDYAGYGDRYGDYDRGVPMRSYPSEYDNIGDRRPMYDDRRGGYMDDRRGYGPINGYDRRPYDGYDERGGYDDRRLPPPPPPPHNNYEDRRPLMGNNRPLLPQGAVNRGPPMGGYDRGPSSNDMYSRRSDYGPKPSMPPPTDVYGTCDTSLAYDNTGVAGGGYAPVADGGYGAASVGYTSSDGSYGVNQGYATAGYDNRTQTAGYNVAGGYATGGYGTGNGGYGTAYGNGTTGYNMDTANYGEHATYDAVYPAPPQPRSFASGTGGPGPRGGGEIPPGAGHRY
ncbi:hypothetical protein RN001_000818 [Aquatica leii]|uniref:RRM domain-containing protein n=1 Tax=Aquatica leii TaxID=1421715 RepID=A0AAN7PFE4_9COLE|nr:hypothetical protein RN001_000818 [Aquatica leii]